MAMLNPAESLSNLENLDKSTLIAMVLYHRKNEERQKQAKLGLAVGPREDPTPSISQDTIAKTRSSGSVKVPSSSDSPDNSPSKPKTPRKSRSSAPSSKSLRRKNSVVPEEKEERPSLRGIERSASVSAHDTPRQPLLRKRSMGGFGRDTVSKASDRPIESHHTSMGDVNVKLQNNDAPRKKLPRVPLVQIPRLEGKFLSIDDFLSDSPLFRKNLRTTELSTEGFLDTLLRLATSVESACTMSQGAARQMEAVAASLNSLREYLAGGSQLDDSFKKSCVFINSLQSAQASLFDQLLNDFLKPIRIYADTQLKKIQLLSTEYYAVVSLLDAAITKYAKKVTIKTSSSYSEIEAIEKKRQELGLPLINKLNGIALQGKIDFLTSVIALIMHTMNYHSSCFSQCNSVPVDFQDFIDQLQAARPKVSAIVSAFPSTVADIPKALPLEHKSMRGFMHYQIVSGAKNSGGESHRRAWERGYFSIDYGYFILTSLLDEAKLQKTRWNILYCGNVKSRTDLDRAFTWEMTAMSQDSTGKMRPKTLLLQADTNEQKTLWMNSVQQTIQDMLSNQKSISTNSRVKIPMLVQVSLANKNATCVDCGNNGPDWASLNLGIMMCIQCSGAHRGLSTSVSKVRSITLDVWDVYAYKLLDALGNNEFNKLMQATEVTIPISKESSASDREAFIRAKYIQKAFLAPIDKQIDQLNAAMFDNILIGDLHAILTSLMYGADPNYKDAKTGMTPLIKAVHNKQYLAAQLLLSNGAHPDFKYGPDSTTALHFFAEQNDPGGISLLISAGATKDIKDKNGSTPEDLCKKPLSDAITRAFLGFVPKGLSTGSASGDSSAMDSSAGRITKRGHIEKIDEGKQEAHQRITELFEQHCSSSESEDQPDSTTNSLTPK